MRFAESKHRDEIVFSEHVVAGVPVCALWQPVPLQVPCTEGSIKKEEDEEGEEKMKKKVEENSGRKMKKIGREKGKLDSRESNIADC